MRNKVVPIDGLPLPPPPALGVKVLDSWKYQQSNKATRLQATLGVGQINTISKTLDLVLSTNSNIHNLEVVPGMSDHDAIVFSFSINHVPDQQPPRKVFLYHKADVEGIKANLLNFQNSFLQQDSSSVNVEVMWNDFKEAVYNTISKHVPQRTI